MHYGVKNYHLDGDLFVGLGVEALEDFPEGPFAYRFGDHKASVGHHGHVGEVLGLPEYGPVVLLMVLLHCLYII